jgi:uncharacterized protein
MVMSPSADAPSPLLDWGLLAVGLVVAALCIWFGPLIAGFIQIESIWAATAAVYALIFLPLILVAMGFSFAGRQPMFPLGDRRARWAGIGLVTGVGGLAMTASLAALAGSIVGGSGGQVGVGLVVGFLVMGFQVVSEELFFRGWVQPLLARRVGWIAAVAIAAGLFAGFHLLGSARSPLTLLNLLIGGIWFGLLAFRSGGLVAPVGAHLGWNVSESLLLGLEPNPGVGDFGSVSDWDLAGSPMWGGSDEGLNASIAMAFVLIAFVIPLVWQPRPIANAAPAPRQPGRAAA